MDNYHHDGREIMTFYTTHLNHRVNLVQDVGVHKPGVTGVTVYVPGGASCDFVGEQTEQES